MMKLNDFIDKLKLAHDVPNYYNNRFPYNCGYYDGSRFSFDCWNLIKAILGGWTDNYTKGYYVSPSDFPTGDCDGYTLLMQCTNRSKDFSQLKQAGTYLYISTSPHAGIYLGDFEYNGHIVNVVECTGAWENKVQYTYVDSNGGRYQWKGGKKNPYSWTDYGLLPYVEYSDQPIIDDRTERVKELQRVLNEQYGCGLAIDGSFGPLTSKACLNNYLYYLKNAPLHVKWLQNRLIELGYSCGEAGIDGSFGPAALQALKQFQSDRGLLCDGYCGSETSWELVK